MGLKPTRGRTPVGPDSDEPASGLSIEFALTRTVRDAAALLDAVQGPGIGDKYIIAPPTRPYTEEITTSPGRLRIAMTTRPWSGASVDHEYAQAVERVAHELTSLGHEVEKASPQVEWEQFLNSQVPVWTSFLAGNAVANASAFGIELSPDVLEATTLACVEYGQRVTALDYSNAMRVWNITNRSVGAFFRTYDVLIMMQIRILGGAMSRVPADATAFAHRDKHTMISVFDTEWQPGSGQHLVRAEQLWQAIRPYAEGVYVNFLADEGEQRVHQAYSPATYTRLAALKQRYDPENLFHLNQNIRPATR